MSRRSAFRALVAAIIVASAASSRGQVPVPAASRSTDFFVKRDGQRQAVSTQNTAIK